MKTKKFMLGAFILTVICFSFSITSGETIKKAIPFPQDIDEQKLMETAMSECMKRGYDLQGGRQNTFQKKFSVGQAGFHVYSIKLSVAPGENGKKVLNLDGEDIGTTLMVSGFVGQSLYQDVTQIEKAVKKYLETR